MPNCTIITDSCIVNGTYRSGPGPQKIKVELDINLDGEIIEQLGGVDAVLDEIGERAVVAWVEAQGYTCTKD